MDTKDLDPDERSATGQSREPDGYEFANELDRMVATPPGQPTNELYAEMTGERR